MNSSIKCLELSEESSDSNPEEAIPTVFQTLDLELESVNFDIE